MYFNTNLYYRLQNRLLWANTSMPTVNQIFHTLLIGLGRYLSIYGLNWLMARSMEQIFEFWKQKKVTGSQIWRIRWLSNDFCFVFSQIFSHNQAGMWRRIILVWQWRASYYLSDANTIIFEHNFLQFFDVIVVSRGGWMTRMRQVFYNLTTLTECFIPLKYLLSRYSRRSKIVLHHF